MKYLQYDPAMADANGIAPIYCQITSEGVPPWPDQIEVADDFDATGLAIDTLTLALVSAPPDLGGE